MAKQMRKIELMHWLYGKKDTHTCGECSNFVSGRYNDRILRKCEVYGLTHSEASDWAKRWCACGHFDKEPTGRPVITMKRYYATKEPAEQLAGQMMIE